MIGPLSGLLLCHSNGRQHSTRVIDPENHVPTIGQVAHGHHRARDDGLIGLIGPVAVVLELNMAKLVAEVQDFLDLTGRQRHAAKATVVDPSNGENSRLSRRGPYGIRESGCAFKAPDASAGWFAKWRRATASIQHSAASSSPGTRATFVHLVIRTCWYTSAASRILTSELDR